MKKTSMLSLFLGIIVTFIGILPFIFAYPYCNGCANSGPSNFWELTLMLSYEGQGWYMITGIVLLLLAMLSLFKRKRVQS
ncbi:LPXTG cell wall anchor domain-containing protein [Brevibacillus daliensis]|uniref:LPXTG cell wall anchor domain-containing protein n=1 Tax=Brevibacillus daliensis TaxID=2892995 RepID=UPI001E564468|nr:LPXTG cell wall anchor domain-containing protein [Brevibacillus daliensis]